MKIVLPACVTVVCSGRSLARAGPSSHLRRQPTGHSRSARLRLAPAPCPPAPGTARRLCALDCGPRLREETPCVAAPPPRAPPPGGARRPATGSPRPRRPRAHPGSRHAPDPLASLHTGTGQRTGPTADWQWQQCALWHWQSLESAYAVWHCTPTTGTAALTLVGWSLVCHECDHTLTAAALCQSASCHWPPWWQLTH